MSQPEAQLNPQARSFCDKLGIDDPVALILKDNPSNNNTPSKELSNSFHSVDQSADQLSFITDEESASSPSQKEVLSLRLVCAVFRT